MSMLSTTDCPEKSGPVSVPSSERIAMDFTVSVGVTTGKDCAGLFGSIRTLDQPGSGVAGVMVPLEQPPTKWKTPSLVTPFKSGAPAPPGLARFVCNTH